MLSQASMAIARQRLPAGGAAIPDIATLFYEKLLADDPELLSNRFNRGGRATAAQQRALAGSIARVATLVVDDPDRDPGPLLPRTESPHSVSHRSSLIRQCSMSSARSPLLLASDGIGCTPVIGILDHLRATSSEREVTVVHADRSAATHALRGRLYRSVSRLVNARARIWYEEPHRGWPVEYTGLVDLGKVDVTADMHAYIFGPVPFIELIREQLLDRGVPATAIRQELFDPETRLLSTSPVSS